MLIYVPYPGVLKKHTDPRCASGEACYAPSPEPVWEKIPDAAKDQDPLDFTVDFSV